MHLRQLRPAGRPGLGPEHAGDRDGALLAHPLGTPGTDALDQPLPGAQGEEGDPAQIPQGVHHPVQGDGPVIPAHHRRVEFRCQNFHANHTFLQKRIKKSRSRFSSFGTEQTPRYHPKLRRRVQRTPLGTLNAGGTGAPTP